ncbi:response regulator transcription factor [Nocardiopsis lambiniae]|uniref:Response regulator transcription factor n=1 Tax=Nocardiopsis lambiniae TaxID=3075539 RepID=A0ABU2M7P6_9ACTN|nr:response regulator transcription factor [Nocardiopsis sp. DSM 44743]MDT0328657.1 response regulator transcription factor [Nocardiopsis sp. DSM 44743]
MEIMGLWLYEASSDAPTPINFTKPSDSYRVLVVESKKHDARMLSEGLLRHGHTVRSAETGRAALGTYKDVDLVLLDLDLPDLDGLEICRLIRASSCVPIIMVSTRVTELDRVLGLRAGADDYMSKPCSIHELIARIDAVMRRVIGRRKTKAEVIFHGPLKIETATRKVHLSGKPVKLTRKEFDLLHILASQPEKVVPRKHIMDRVWGGGWSRRTIDTHVSSLRRKLGEKDWIVTVRGIGFQIGLAPDQESSNLSYG